MDTKRRVEPELEQSIREWLAAVLGSPLPSSQSIADALYTGEQLCLLVNHIRPGIVKRINHSPMIAFKQMENISKFLAACKELGLSQNDLFTTIDLHQNRDSALVILCLRVLANKAASFDSYAGPYLKGTEPSARMSPVVIRTTRVPSAIPALASSPAQSPAASAAVTTATITTVAAPSNTTTSSSSSSSKPASEHTAVRSASDVPSTTTTSTNNNTSSTGSVATTRSRSPSSATRAASVASLDMDIQVKEALKYDPELERAALRWIRSVLHEESDTLDFYSYMKDGSRLCRLMNAIRAGTIPNIYTGGSNTFKHRENIQHYLDACRTVGLPSTGLFNTSDLYERRNLNLVVSNIHMLSSYIRKSVPEWNGPKLVVESRNDQSFLYAAAVLNDDATCRTLDDCTPLSGDDQALLDWINGKLRLHPEYGKEREVWHARSISNDFHDGILLLRLLEVLTQQPIGNINWECSLLWNKMENAVAALRVIAQHTHAQYSSPSAPPTAFATNKTLVFEGCSAQDIVKGNTAEILRLLRFVRTIFDTDSLMESISGDTNVRAKLVDSLVSLENVFVSSLTLLQSELVEPLRVAASSEAPILSEHQMRVFDNLAILAANHAQLRAALLEAQLDFGATTSLNRVFELLCDLRLFEEVANVWHIEALRVNNIFFNTVVHLFDSQQGVANGLDLTSHLLLPVQLLPRYLQVLQDFTKYTNDIHADDVALQAATAHLSQLAASIRNHVSNTDCIRKLQQLQQSIEPTMELLKAKRRFIIEGFMSVQGELPLESDELAEFQRLATESQFLFLLSDLLIVTRYCPSAVGDAAAGGHKNKPFKLIAAYPLSDLSDLGLDSTNPCVASLRVRDNTVRLVGTTPELLEMWYSALKAGLTGQLIVSDDELSDVSDSDDEEELIDLASLPDPTPLTRSNNLVFSVDDDLALSDDD